MTLLDLVELARLMKKVAITTSQAQGRADSFMDLNQLMEYFGIHRANHEKFRKRLERFRKAHAMASKMYTERDMPARNEARFLYRPDILRLHIQMDDLILASKAKTSAKRPSEK